MQKGDGVTAPGQGDDQRARTVGLQPGGQAGFRPDDPVGIRLAQPGRRAGGRVAVGARVGAQAKRVLISVARVRWAAVAVAA